jgi:NADH:ubiquinone oxidoreductase subunit F (NADH-binding)
MPSAGIHVEERVLPREELGSLAAYRERGGGRGWDAARQLSPAELIDLVAAAGLRGRGGAGFPTGEKWRTVASFASPTTPSTVVVNGAEGEPGSFKDRAIMRRNPYAVIEGALIAARAVGADRVAIAVKDTFDQEHRRLSAALAECEAAGWCERVNVGVVAGPGEYLFGEETALLEVLDGRPPFPRLAPPYRQGVDEMGPEPREPGGAVLATLGRTPGPPPTLVNNVETLANVPAIIAEGPERFRALGTDESPGTVVCTISGSTRLHGVAEVPMGTTLADAIALIGGDGTRRGERLVAALSGVANPVLTAEQFATPLTYEHMRAAGSGLGACGFVVFDDTTDFAAVAAGVARFLAVESCGQCTPCKQDGGAIADRLTRICRGEGSAHELDELRDLLDSVADGARCFLATQHQVVVASLLREFPDAFTRHVDGSAAPSAPVLIAPIVDLDGDTATLDERHAEKQPDWTFDAVDSGKAPVERLAAGGTDAPAQ